MLMINDLLRHLLKKQLQVHLRHMLFLGLNNIQVPMSAAKIRLNYADTSGIEFWAAPCLHDIFCCSILISSFHVGITCFTLLATSQQWLGSLCAAEGMFVATTPLPSA